MQRSHAGARAGASASSSSMTTSVIPPSLEQPPPTSSSAVVRGRNRELQLLNNEMQLLQEELNSLDNVPPASKACKDFVTFVESRADPFFPKHLGIKKALELSRFSSDGVAPQAWPFDRPVKAARCCWKF